MTRLKRHRGGSLKVPSGRWRKARRSRSDRSDCVRAAIALREDISEEIAMALANDSSAYVRHRLVCNPNIPVKIIELLSKDINLISKDGNSSVQIEIIRNIESIAKTI